MAHRRHLALALPIAALAVGLAAPPTAPALAEPATPTFDYTCTDRYPAAPADVVRLWGNDRYETAIEVSRIRYGNGQGCNVSIASGRSFPDALTAAADSAWGPLLLVPGSTIPPSVRAEIRRLGPRWFNTYGGRGVLTPSVMSELSGIVDGRIVSTGGANRYGTAAVATYDAERGSVAYVTTGVDFPDALAAAALIRAARGALLLVGTDSIPAETQFALRNLQPSRIVVIGGTGAVSARVERALRTFTTGGVTRIAGVDRFDTAVQVSRTSAPSGDWAVTIVSGRSFADAISAARLGAGPVLLVEPNAIPDVVADELRRLSPRTIYIVGGPGAVSEAVELELAQYLSD